MALAAAALVIALVLVVVFGGRKEGPAPDSGQGGPVAIPVRSGEDVPDYAWWSGPPFKKLRSFIVGEKANTYDNTFVAYVTPDQARRVRKGLWITSSVLSVHTIRPSSPWYETIKQEELPGEYVKRKPGVGTVYAGDNLHFAIVVPDEGDELIAVTAYTPHLLDWGISNLQRGRKTSDASNQPAD